MKNRSKTFDDELKLIETTVIYDDFSRPIVTETEKTIFCKELSIGSNENYQARQHDVFLEKKFAIHSFEYSGEKIVEFKGKRYQVERVYGQDLTEAELTVSEIRDG